MIEVLVSLTVVAFGLLGLAGLQARSMSFQKDSFDRKAAAEIAAQMAERIRANYDGFTAGNYNRTMLPTDPVPAAIPVCANAQDCTSAEIANARLGDVADRPAASPAGFGRVSGGAGELDTNDADHGLAGRPGHRWPARSDLHRRAGPTSPDPQYRCFSWILHP